MKLALFICNEVCLYEAMKIFLTILVFSAICSVFAFGAEQIKTDDKPAVHLVNQVLFEIRKEAFTTIDFKNYLKTKKELKIQALLPLVQNELEEFILFRLCLLEIQKLDYQFSPEDPQKKSSPEQIELLQVQSFLKLKEKHIGQIERYKSWTDVLKRKYNYLPKMTELKAK